MNKDFTTKSVLSHLLFYEISNVFPGDLSVDVALQKLLLCNKRIFVSWKPTYTQENYRIPGFILYGRMNGLPARSVVLACQI